MTYLKLLFCLFSLSVQAEELLSFQALMKKPEMIQNETIKLELSKNTAPPDHHVYLNAHVEKLKKMQKILSSKQIEKSLQSLHQTAVAYNWNQTSAITRKLSSLCDYTSVERELCFEKLTNLREFILNQNLSPERQNNFIAKLDIAEEHVIEFDQLNNDFATYFDEEVKILNQANTTTTSSSITIVPKSIEQSSTLPYQFIAVAAALLGVIFYYQKKQGFENNRYTDNKWIKKINFANNREKKIVLTHKRSIGHLVNFIQANFDDTVVKYERNRNNMTLQLKYKCNTPFLIKLDEPEMSTARNALLRFDSALSSKDQILIQDEYDQDGKISFHHIKIIFSAPALI